jgi:hypothetical protein
LVVESNSSRLARRDSSKACILEGVSDTGALNKPFVLGFAKLDLADGAGVTIGRILGFLIEDAESLIIFIWACNRERRATCDIGCFIEFKGGCRLPLSNVRGGVVFSLALNKKMISRHF